MSDLNWAQSNSLPSGNEWVCSAISDNGLILIALSGAGYLWKSTNSGSTWSMIINISSQIDPDPDNNRKTIAIKGDSNMQNLILMNYQIGVFVSNNYGITWTLKIPRPTGYLNRYNNVFVSTTGQYMYWRAIDSNRPLYKSTDYGNTFSTITFTTSGSYTGISVSADGSKILYRSSPGLGNEIRISTDYGVTFGSIITIPNAEVVGSICLDSTGQYAICSGGPNYNGICISSDGGLTWTNKIVSAGGITYNANNQVSTPYSISQYNPISISSNGKIIQLPCKNKSDTPVTTDNSQTITQYIFTSIDSGATWTLTGIPTGYAVAQPEAPFIYSIPSGYKSVFPTAVYSSSYGYPLPVRPLYIYNAPVSITYYGNNNTGGTIPVDGNIYPFSSSTTALGTTGQLTRTQYNFIGWNTASNGTGTNYQMGDTFQIIYTSLYANWEIARCFKEDSTILCFIDGEETYVPVQNIKTGTLVKTHLSGYIPVNMIGTSKLYNPNNGLRSKHRLFRYSKNKYPELTEDLIITGCHSILVTELTETQKKLSIELTGDIYVTENRYRLIAMLDENSEPYDEEGVFNIWHFALDNDDMYSNYGVYANGGLLVETCSKRMMTEYSGLELKE